MLISNSVNYFSIENKSIINIIKWNSNENLNTKQLTTTFPTFCTLMKYTYNYCT